MLTDETLYERVLAGDLGALEALVHRYHSPLLGFLYRQVGDRHLAEDLVQDTFTRMCTYDGAPPRHFKAWAFAIAANLARDHFRSAAVRREQAGETAGQAEAGRLVGPAPAVDELLLRDDDRRAVAGALQRLPDYQREVLVLRFYHSMTMEEIADVTGAPLGTVKSRSFHGLKQMKLMLSAEGGISHGEAPSRPDRRTYR